MHLTQGVEQLFERHLLIGCEVGYPAKKPMGRGEVAVSFEEAQLTYGRLSPKQIIREFDITLTEGT
jgi:lactam utilization protein B